MKTAMQTALGHLVAWGITMVVGVRLQNSRVMKEARRKLAEAIVDEQYRRRAEDVKKAREYMQAVGERAARQ